MITQEVQDLTRQVALNTNIEAASKDALDILVKQLADFNAALASAPNTMSAEDIAALKANAADLAASAQALQVAIPSNTQTPLPGAAPAVMGVGYKPNPELWSTHIREGFAKAEEFVWPSERVSGR